MNMSAEVDAWFDDYESPLTGAMLRVREVVLSADERMEECVKWSTPTFTFQGNLASFQPRAKKFVSLLVHRGSEVPGDHPVLEGDAPLARTMRFADVQTCRRAGRSWNRWCAPGATRRTEPL